MLTLAKALRSKTTTRQPMRAPEDAAADATLHIRFSDAGWQAAVQGPEGSMLWSESGRCFTDANNASSPVSMAISAVEHSGVSDRVGAVIVLADDPALQLVDHRLARLTNFEPRALKEFGSQQVGGHPVAYSSMPFGASSAREIERRILGFIPEDSLEAMFFGLGRFATSLVAVLPGPIGCFGAEARGIFSMLRTHGDFSHFVIGNAETGIIVVRRLPFGAFTLARAYGEEHGLALEPASAALRSRSRLPPAEVLKGETLPPEYRTATNLRLAPELRRLRDDLAATIDYFQFERLAGRPAGVSLVFGGTPIAGFVTWLSEALDLQVDLVEEGAAFAATAGDTYPLNLLEGTRPGLLRLGAEQFEFVEGRFRPIKTVQTGVAMKAASGLGEQFPILKKMPALSFLQAANSIVITRQHMMGAVAVCGALALAVIGNQSFVAGPAKTALALGTAGYGTTAAESIAAVARQVAEEGGAASTRHPLWAEDLVSVARSALPDMRITRLAFVGTQNGQPVPTLEISGALNGQSASNLKLVADFIDRLEEDSTFRRRFGEIAFTGASEAPLDGDDMNFRVMAKMTAGPPQ
jgi:hypothetical protein